MTQQITSANLGPEAQQETLQDYQNDRTFGDIWGQSKNSSPSSGLTLGLGPLFSDVTRLPVNRSTSFLKRSLPNTTRY
jgi:hypothetical protein